MASLLALWITSLGAWLFLVVTGYLKTPQNWGILIFGLIVAVMSLFWLGLVWALVMTFIDKDQKWMRGAFAGGVIVLGGLLVWLYWSGFVSGH